MHYTADIVLVSTVLAGVKKSCGFSYVALPSSSLSNADITLVVLIAQRQVESPNLRSGPSPRGSLELERRFSMSYNRLL